MPERSAFAASSSDGSSAGFIVRSQLWKQRHTSAVRLMARCCSKNFHLNPCRICGTGSQRLQLVGNNDGTERYIIGYLTISNGGSTISFTPPAATAYDPRLNSTGAIVDFGSVKTDGMLSMTQENGMWVLCPFPRYRNFTIYLNSDDYPMPSSVLAAGSTTSTVVPVANGSHWQLPLNGSKTYSWPVN